MNRTTFVVAVAIAAAVGSVVPATAGTGDPVIPRPVSELLFPDADRPGHPDKAEPLRMACQGRTDGEQAAIACRWTGPRHREVAAYQLWRGTSRDDAAVIWRGTAQHHVDTTAEPGHEYGYLVEALSHDGTVVGRSPAVWASADGNPSHA